MKKSIMIMLALVGSLVAQQNYSGIYNGKGVAQSTRYPGGVPVTMQITLLQAGESLTGTLKIGNAKPRAIASGTVTGTSLTFATTGQGQSTAQLAVSGNQLTGKMTSSTGVVYALALTKQ